MLRKVRREQPKVAVARPEEKEKVGENAGHGAESALDVVKSSEKRDKSKKDSKKQENPVKKPFSTSLIT